MTRRRRRPVEALEATGVDCGAEGAADPDEPVADATVAVGSGTAGTVVAAVVAFVTRLTAERACVADAVTAASAPVPAAASGAGEKRQSTEPVRGSVPFDDSFCLRFWSHFQPIRFPIDMRDR